MDDHNIAILTEKSRALFKEFLWKFRNVFGILRNLASLSVFDKDGTTNIAEDSMRILTISSAIFFCLGTLLVAQYQPSPVPPSNVPAQQGGGQPPWMQMQEGGNIPQQRRQGMQGTQGGMGRMQPGGMQPGGLGGMQPPAGGMQRMQQNAAGQANLPRTANPNQVTQTIARLRGMDANGNGILEANEIPANQQDRVNAMVMQLGGNPGSQINLANLERRAAAGNTAGNNARPNQTPQQADSNANRQRRTQTVEPLVRPFGETNTQNTPVLGFGQRAADAQTSQAARAGGRQQREREAAALANLAAQTARNAQMPKVSTAYDNIQPTVRNNPVFGWFFEYDTDQDGQITMNEYVNARGGIWTPDIANEFLWLDRNCDGFATVDESLASLRELDEQRALEQGTQLAAVTGRRLEGTQNRQPPAATRQNAANSAYPNRESAGNAGNQGNQGRQQMGTNFQRGSGQQNTGTSPGGGRGRGGR